MKILETALNSLLKVVEYAWAKFYVELTAPTASIGVVWLLLFVIYAFLAVKLSWAYDAYLTVDPKYTGDRSARGIFHWIFPKKLLFSKSIRMDLKILALLLLSEGFIAIFFYDISEPTFYARHFGLKLATLVHLDPSTLSPATLGEAKSSVGEDIVYVIVMWVALQFGYWIAHLLLHKIPFLWEFHKLHHAAEQLSGTTEYRNHIVDDYCHSFWAGSCMAVVAVTWSLAFGHTPLGESTWIAFWALQAIRLPISTLHHSHLWISFGKFEYFFLSPAMHTIHHSRDPKHQNKNYGLLLSVFDVIFGTAYRTEKTPPQELKIGLDDGFDWNNATLWQIFIKPIRASLGHLRFSRSKSQARSQSRQRSSRPAA